MIPTYHAYGTSWKTLGEGDSITLVRSDTDVIDGESYKFRYRAINVHGPGPFSEESEIKMTGVPEKLTGITSRYGYIG